MQVMKLVAVKIPAVNAMADAARCCNGEVLERMMGPLIVGNKIQHRQRNNDDIAPQPVGCGAMSLIGRRMKEDYEVSGLARIIPRTLQ